MNQQNPNTDQTLTYPLAANGYIHHWLVLGPQARAVANLEELQGENFKAQIAQHYYQPEHPITVTPAEQAKMTLPAQGEETTLPWRTVRCDDDHFVDCSAFYHTCHHLTTYAYAQLVAPAAGAVNFVLATNGPADVWINGDHALRTAHFSHQMPQRIPFTAQLQAGVNEILVRFEAVAVRECPYVMALQATEVDATIWQVYLPTTLRKARRNLLEQLFDAAYLDQAVYHREDEIIVRWPDDLKLTTKITIRLQTPEGRIYAEGSPIIKAGATANLGKAYQRRDGLYWVTLMPEVEEYYVHGMRIVRHLPLYISNNKFSEVTYGDYETRRREALLDAANRTDNIYAEIAKIELGEWDKVKADIFTKAIARINQREDCSDFYLVGLLGLLARHGHEAAFPATLREQIEACALNFKYWMDEPTPAGTPDAMCYWSENHQILFHACEVLAGQLFPELTFTNANQAGAWHQAKGERLALTWLHKRGVEGFREWDSNTYFEHDVLALSHLADLAQNDEVAEMAAIILDKLAFTMALNSYRGVFGSTHGRTYAPYIKGGRLELTSGVGRLLWGLGSFNEHMLGTVALACAQNYMLPPLIEQIGANYYEEFWGRERHAGELVQERDCATGAWAVNKVTYKTPDYMLCSAQDYRPGQPGYQQHIWQATFGPDAAVFTTHPVCSSQDGSHRPNFWHGNGILPRVAQWKDVLVALYNLPADDWMGFTHAYFPTKHFDEYLLHADWAFARKGEGYLALRASQSLTLVTTGTTAYRELRSPGLQNAWFCHMGRTAVDGDFATFQASLLALDMSFEPLAIHAETLRNESIDFGWTGPLLVNETEQPLNNFKHYESPFCEVDFGAETMEIRSWEQGMQLDFSLRSV